MRIVRGLVNYDNSTIYVFGSFNIVVNGVMQSNVLCANIVSGGGDVIPGAIPSENIPRPHGGEFVSCFLIVVVDHHLL
jgi:hypothetical protein